MRAVMLLCSRVAMYVRASMGDVAIAHMMPHNGVQQRKAVVHLKGCFDAQPAVSTCACCTPTNNSYTLSHCIVPAAGSLHMHTVRGCVYGPAG